MILYFALNRSHAQDAIHSMAFHRYVFSGLDLHTIKTARCCVTLTLRFPWNSQCDGRKNLLDQCSLKDS